MKILHLAIKLTEVMRLNNVYNTFHKENSFNREGWKADFDWVHEGQKYQIPDGP